ncbi:HNH endonuclease [Demequina pelophila]|uniref:HNH endonuclease n=1 Tax=Demequina pelophila TaxID=1638984 RepID=UPI00078425AE|nr:HNH endonuclease signature motif containing protein [Demequina pelophila]
MADPTATDTIAQLRARVLEASALPEKELLLLQRDIVASRRELDVLLAMVNADVSERSKNGAAGLARRNGFRTADDLNAAASGGTKAEAERLRRVGERIRQARNDAGAGSQSKTPPGGGAGEKKGPVLPFLAAALERGELSPDAGVLVEEVLMLHPEAREATGLRVDPRARKTRLGALPLTAVEQVLVKKATGLPLRSVRQLVAKATADLTPVENAEEQQEDLYRRRFAVLHEQRDGMVKLEALLDPLTAAPLIAAVDGFKKAAFRARRDNGPESDTRTAQQMTADALGWLGRHATSCDAPHDGIKTTINIRMTLDDLMNATGYGTIDGISLPMTAGSLRCHAADAQVIPTVLGGGSEVLDHGRARRLFTTAQRRAIAERDGGCARCGVPVHYCDVHHITWWSAGGLTNVDNGVLLCVSCHHWIHRERWDIRVRDGKVEFLPPPSADPLRRPQAAYRERTSLGDAELAMAAP